MYILDFLILLHLPAYVDGTECSEMLAYKIQMPENYPEESIQHTEYIINDNQIPNDNNKNSHQKLKNIHSHHLVYQRTEKGKVKIPGI